MEPLRAAVIGVGYFGSRHADKLARLPGVKLEYIVDTDRARAEAIASKVGARATPSSATSWGRSTSPRSRCRRRRTPKWPKRCSAPASICW